MVRQFSCQIIRQKSFKVSWVGPVKHNIKKSLQKATEINSTLRAVGPTARRVKQWRHYTSNTLNVTWILWWTKIATILQWHQQYKTLYNYGISYQKANLECSFYNYVESKNTHTDQKAGCLENLLLSSTTKQHLWHLISNSNPSLINSVGKNLIFCLFCQLRGQEDFISYPSHLVSDKNSHISQHIYGSGKWRV